MSMGKYLPLLAALALGTSVAAANAQEGGPGAAYEPSGLRAGSFVILPSTELSATYSDNIFRTDTNTVDDFIFTIEPQVEVQSNWGRHALNLYAGLQHNFYDDNSDEDNTNWVVGTDGRLDITGNTNIEGELSYRRAHEERGTPAALALAAEPTPYDALEAAVTLNQRFNRMTASVGASYADLDFDSVDAIGGGTINNDDRDREEFGQMLRLGYEVSPDTSVFVEGRLNQRRYDLQPPASAVNRDSDGYAVEAGLSFPATRLIRGEIGIGYQEQTYDSAAFDDVSGLAYHADVTWLATPLTTVRFGAGAEVGESTVGGSGGYLAQYGEVGVDHELLRNVILDGSFRFENADYEDVSRNDDYIDAGVGVSYLVNRYAKVRVGYDYAERSSDAVGLDYEENRVGISLILQR
ncbi:outer membrane beta-barrel protein [Parvibaculum sp.]|jgi:hypothetical protein|uniref:outer membrane beta-barrel protein n=2 Tax=Parvibaculum sp. TaxID=2024848 RepID=UPI002FDA01DE